MEQELLTLPEPLGSPPVFSGVRVTRSLVLYVCLFVCRCLSFCTLSFDHCVVCSSSIYGLCLPLWYLQTLHVIDREINGIDLSLQLDLLFVFVTLCYHMVSVLQYSITKLEENSSCLTLNHIYVLQMIS